MLIRWKEESDPAGRARVVAKLVADGARHVVVEHGIVVVNGEITSRTSREAFAREPAVASVTELSPSDEIDACRDQIDSIDAALVKLLDERIAVALAIGRAKRTAGIATRVPEREALVLRRVAALARDPAVVRAFEAIVDVTRKAQDFVDDAA